MSGQRQYAIMGAGAVGGYYGGLLARAGHPVHFLFHNDYKHALQHGLRIESPKGNFHLQKINAYNDPKKMPRCDIVVVALKTTSNMILHSILPNVLKDDGFVLTLQNGLGSEDEIAEIVGAHRVLGGLCFLCSNKVGPAHIRHSDYGLITLGEYRADGLPGDITPRIERLGIEMQSAGIALELIEDLALARWKKLVWNIPFNGLSVVHNMLTDMLIHSPETRALCKILMNEVAKASGACCRPIESSFIEKMLDDTAKMKPYATSMKLDFDRGRPMEIESIYGNPVRAARSAGVEMPETEKLYNQLLVLDSNR